MQQAAFTHLRPGHDSAWNLKRRQILALRDRANESASVYGKQDIGRC